MLSQNTKKKPKLAWRYSLLCCMLNVIEAKVHDLCVTLVGVAVSFIYVTLHFMQSSGWRIGKRLLGAVYYMIIKEIDSQSENCDREEAR